MYEDSNFSASVKWYLTVFLICISLMANDANHPFMRLLVISLCSSRTVYSNLLLIFKYGSFSFHCLVVQFSQSITSDSLQPHGL